ncbi:MAG: hypothetical protein J7528_06775 [Caulobacter sp.]|nr:hypothetical protein [Caulobacter sp.]
MAGAETAHTFGCHALEPFVGGLRSPKCEAEFLGVPVLKRRRRVSGSSNAAAFPYLIQAGG